MSLWFVASKTRCEYRIPTRAVMPCQGAIIRLPRIKIPNLNPRIVLSINLSTIDNVFHLFYEEGHNALFSDLVKMLSTSSSWRAKSEAMSYSQYDRIYSGQLVKIRLEAYQPFPSDRLEGTVRLRL